MGSFAIDFVGQGICISTHPYSLEAAHGPVSVLREFSSLCLQEVETLQPVSGRGRTKVKSSHRAVEVGESLWRSSPTPCSDQGKLEQVAQNIAQLGTEYLQGWWLCNLSGEPVSVLDHSPYRKVFFFSLCI